MSSGNKKKTADGEVTYYDVAAGVSRKGKAHKLASKYSSKDTVNLCIRERKGLSAELFFLILAGILIVLLLLEFFGVYRPYLNLETAEQQLADQRAEIELLEDSMSDYQEIQQKYNQFNYENFPRERVGSDEMFDLIKETVFSRALITSFRFNGNANRLTLDIEGNNPDDLTVIVSSIRAKTDLVQQCNYGNWKMGTGFKTTLTIDFKPAK